MTLFKQMALAITIMIVALLGIVMAINYKASKSDMVETLFQTTVNNIGTLADKLAETGGDKAELESIIDAEAGGGYFKMIDFQSTDGKSDYKQLDNDPVKGVPLWFIEYSNIELESISATVTAGWDIIGEVTVLGDTAVVYKALFKMFENYLYIFGISISIFLIILSVMLRFILKPLKDIEILSKNISQGKFETIEKIPSTLELKNVSLSMNDMSNKIKSMISKLNNNLEKMTDELSKDDLTGLEQEQTFNTDMKMMFIKKKDGYIFSIKIDNFGEFAKNNAKNIVDKFLKDFANILSTCNVKTTAYRFFGSNFALISKITDYDEILKLSKELQNSFKSLGDEYGISNVAHIGATPFNPISTTDEIFEFANMAYDKAKTVGANEFFIRDKGDLAKDMLVWKELVCGVIDNSTFHVGYIHQALSMDSDRKVLLEEAFTSAVDSSNKTIQIGTFISVAEMYNKIVDFDKAVIGQIVEYIRVKKVKNEILINLAFDSLLDDEFNSWLIQTLNSNKDISSQLVFSMTAYGCVRDIEAFKKFITLVHDNGAKVILKRFETKFIPLDSLKELNLDYIRLAREYTNDISSDRSKQSFVESICELSKLLNIKVFSEDAKDESDFNKLRELGIYGASIKHIMKYNGTITQGVVSYCMDNLEDNIVNFSLMTKVSTVSVELLQNMMNYSKDLKSDQLSLTGYIEVTKDEDFNYYVHSENIISLEDMKRIEPTLAEILTLDSAGIRKRYRELRKSGVNTHAKGGGIGFYEIAKLTSKIEYRFDELNKERYSFKFKVRIDNKIKKSD
ncbi:MAG: EAL domain-containing protein [Helicobacteraceae bacterium]|nr:EAL domain-containing protein [Helicobacteraceae bacterium]